MALPPASERGIPQPAEIKLTEELTRKDLQAIAEGTGGVVFDTVSIKTNYSNEGVAASGGVLYPDLHAEFRFVGYPGYPREALVDDPGATLTLDNGKTTVSLNDTALVLGQNSVTFVERPQVRENVRPAAGSIPTLDWTTVIITKEQVALRRIAVPANKSERDYGISDDEIRAAKIADIAYEAKRK